MGKQKRQAGEQRLAELRDLAAARGFEVRVFSPVHVRVFGRTVIDWPTSSRAWVAGSPEKTAVRSPAEVIATASSGREQVAPVVMIRSTHVWCGRIPPRDESLGEYREFTPQEKAEGIVCMRLAA